MSITVIIPTFNRAGFLEQAALSVAGQTMSCDELVIIDDGSTDTTPQVVERLAERFSVPLRYHYKENKGAAAARNEGIRRASCEYLCFLDSDDRFEPDKLYLQYSSMRQAKSLISHTGETWFRRGKLLQQKSKHRPREGYIFAECLRMCVIGMSTVMIKKELFAKHGLFNEQLPCCEDYDFWLRVSTREKFHLVKYPLTVKDGGRQDQLSVIYRQGMDRYRILSIVNLLEQQLLTTEQRRQAIGELRRKCLIYGNGCVKHGKEEEGRFYLGLPSRFGG